MIILLCKMQPVMILYPFQEVENYITTLSERMLGGGKADYYTDGKVLENSGVLGQSDPSVPRFEPANPGSPITDIINSTDSYALKAITNDAAKQLANEKASLFITGNHSERGGGIGNQRQRSHRNRR